jgi:phosphoenolpyruvate synthase/pyruvate phosphate dikinase
VREAELATLRADMLAAPVNADFQALLQAKLAADYPDITMRFRTSTNSEDLDGFPCAGCYESQTGDPANWETVLDAVRGAWSSIWLYRTFEERSYYGIDHASVAMALLVHHNFPAEEANGVATTNNPFDVAGLEPAFYINVQWGGDAEVVHPPPNVSSDSFLYFFDNPNQPITFIGHSNLVPEGETVLDLSQTHELGVALKAIHERFSAAYGPKAGNQGWYAMDVEFKFDDMNQADGKPHLYVKQARPYPARTEN